jgi:hypothetical protein
VRVEAAVETAPTRAQNPTLVGFGALVAVNLFDGMHREKVEGVKSR